MGLGFSYPTFVVAAIGSTSTGFADNISTNDPNFVDTTDFVPQNSDALTGGVGGTERGYRLTGVEMIGAVGLQTTTDTSTPNPNPNPDPDPNPNPNPDPDPDPDPSTLTKAQKLAGFANSITLTSPNGTQYTLGVSNGGGLTTTAG